jgi:glycosyltransferase involved in cell wall biosynthesis
VQPFVIPFYDVATIRRLNARLLTSLLQTKIRAMSFERPILMSGTPLMADIVGTLKETSSHYFCTDDYSKFENVFDAFDGMEQLMIQKVDCMFATSEVLLRTRRPKQREGVFLPQGVDTLHFSRRPGEIPESMQMLPKPIVGFFGMIASWVDMDLVVKCARKYPNASFVLIGRLGIDPKVFDGMSNIRYLGEISYEQLPRYAQAFDVGLIPFVKNELTTAANPLKMLEYLSLGIPVVSTALPETEKFEDIIHVAQSGNDFVEYVGLALGENSIEEQMRRRHRAEGYSWNRIVDLVSDSIEHIERQQA